MNTKMAVYWIYGHYILLGTITYKYLFLKALFEPLNFSQLPLWWDIDEPFPGGFFCFKHFKSAAKFIFLLQLCLNIKLRMSTQWCK